MNGIGTDGENKANVLSFKTLDEHVMEKTAATVRRNAAAWSKASWDIDQALAAVRREKAEGSPEAAAVALRNAQAVMHHVERWMTDVRYGTQCLERDLIYRAFSETIR